ncbi:ATP-binding protein [Inediibacterium massiliense]|uniref:ATP-binding protein n=1 Tax=Inediibacterium massiliense TaxID=1658111 RepID=UPI0006B69A0C|nr:ATP-binding protein [Inediibacterium massiliense]
MKSRLQIREIDYDGKTKHSSITLKDGLNVIHGESNTGKSLILLSIQHVFGKDHTRKLNGIPELIGYSTISITIETKSGEYRITRDIRDNSKDIIVCFIDTNSVEYCRPKNATKKKRTISEFLLSILDGTGFQLRKNANGDKINLTYNKLMLVSILDEAKIISAEWSPFLSGVLTTATEERSAFKLYLQNEDDSKCNPVEKKEVIKTRLSGSINSLLVLKQELLNEIDELSDDISSDLDYDPKQELNDLQERISVLNTEILRLREEQSLIITEQRKLKTEKLFSQEIINRFNLYIENLFIDRERLQFIQEGNFYLDQLVDIKCPTCGSEFAEKCDSTSFFDGYKKEAYEAELTKIHLQIKDIKQSIGYHQKKIGLLSDSITTMQNKYNEIQNNIEIIIDNELDPVHIEIEAMEEKLLLKNTITQKQLLLKKIATQMAELDRQLVAPVEKCNYDSSIKLNCIDEYIKYLDSNLTAWLYPAYNICEFNENTLDISLDNKLRISNGKGHRAILAAAMVVSLLEYCTFKDFLHNGFVVLDSPLLSLKERSKVKSNEIIADVIADNFFKELALKSGIQIIVLENKEPPKIDKGSIHVIEFTNGHKEGRDGLLE